MITRCSLLVLMGEEGSDWLHLYKLLLWQQRLPLLPLSFRIDNQSMLQSIQLKHLVSHLKQTLQMGQLLNHCKSPAFIITFLRWCLSHCLIITVHHLIQHRIVHRSVRHVKALTPYGRHGLISHSKKVSHACLNDQLVLLKLRDVLLDHGLQDQQLVCLFVVLEHQIKTWGEEGIDVHNPLQKVTVQFVFKHIACLLYALVLHLDFLVDLDGKVLYVFLQIDDAPVQSNQLVVQ